MNTNMAAAHRAAFLNSLESGIAIICTGGERVRSRDTHYKFRPDSDFWYLTAFPEPEAIAVFAPDRDEGQFVLFVRPRDLQLEIWNGRRAGVEGAKEIYGADQAFSIDEFDTQLPKLLKGAETLHYRTGMNADFDRKLLSAVQTLHAKTRDGARAPTAVVDPSSVLHEMRLYKSADELNVMRRAAEITDKAHRAAMKALRGGGGEWAIESIVDATFRAEGGWGPGYTTISAGGNNACVLHYTTNDMTVAAGDCLLLDAGCEFDGYTADVTRTFPASGTFSAAQRELYEVVLAAQEAGCAQAVAGNRFHSVHDVATRKLVEGLLDVGLVNGSVDELLESNAYSKYTVHRTSHWLGIDVHDVGAYYEPHSGNGSPESRELQPGMVLTVEPGVYVASDDNEAPERFRGLGIRIEDDVAITEGGHDNLTGNIPKSISDVEAAC
ncbi:MAG: aminopeptidase P N-terminal domain-containing protein [Planctomycetota bacterium]|nr:aminopeptidase P N-terminal domain-containing protein [Planctomycetota bacterium]